MSRPKRLPNAVSEQFAILAYCLMPDHAHLLVEGLNDSSDLQHFVKMAKQRSGGDYRRRSNKRLWQEGYFDRVLRDEEDARDFARYIINNPVRAALVTSPLDYAHLGSTLWTVEELVESLV
jgi:REP element-mobilizing transposase RayT